MTSLYKLSRTSRFLFLLPTLFVQACLPGSNSEPKTLFPADSLSRSVAATFPVERLELVWEKTRESDGFGHLSSLRYSGSKIVLSDIEQAKIWTYDINGQKQESALKDTLFFPYLLSAKDDSLIVFNAGSRSIEWYADEKKYQSLTLPKIDEGESLSYFPTVHEGKVYLKTQPENGRSVFYEIDPNDGSIEQEKVLNGPAWTHKGFLRSSGPDLLSISSYYPAIYRMQNWASADSVRLQGFDSPMLARMRNRAIGESDDAPLMISSATLKDSLYFVTNLRPGWARVDVFDYDGKLQAILEEELPPAPTDYNTLDLEVISDGDDYLIALIAVKQVHKRFSLEYHSKLSLFRWNRQLIANSK